MEFNIKEFTKSLNEHRRNKREKEIWKLEKKLVDTEAKVVELASIREITMYIDPVTHLPSQPSSSGYNYGRKISFTNLSMLAQKAIPEPKVLDEYEIHLMYLSYKLLSKTDEEIKELILDIY